MRLGTVSVRGGHHMDEFRIGGFGLADPLHRCRQSPNWGGLSLEKPTTGQF